MHHKRGGIGVGQWKMDGQMEIDIPDRNKSLRKGKNKWVM